MNISPVTNEFVGQACDLALAVRRPIVAPKGFSRKQALWYESALTVDRTPLGNLASEPMGIKKWRGRAKKILLSFIP